MAPQEAFVEDVGVRFRNVVHASPMGMHMYRLADDGRLVFIGANPAADRLLGVDNSQFIGMTLEQAFPPLAGTEIPERYRRAAAEGVPWQTKQITYADDRIEGAYEIYAFQTSPGQMAVMFLEITDRLKAEEAIRESEELFRGYFELGRIGMAITSPDRRWVHVNDQLCSILGHSREELAETTWDALTHPQDVEQENERFERLLAGEVDGYSLEKRFQRRDGAEVHARQFVSCLRREDGAPQHILMHVEDITERRSLEEQLRQSQKMEAIGRLAGGVAHDFNNILTGILGYAELIIASIPEGNPLRAEMAEILRAAERGAGLTQQLLAFSRKQIITPQRLDLNASVANSERLLGRIIGEDIDLVHRPGEDLWIVEADPGQIDQVLVNLATNSRDAMPDGGKLTIETANVDVDDLYCHSNP
jgi:PAS domain S-box-containing protein